MSEENNVLVNEEVIVESVDNTETKPDLYITVPKAENGVDPVEFAARTKAALGKQYNIIFVNPQETEGV